MGTFTAATAIPTGGLITSAWMTNTVGDLNFLGAAGGATVAKDLCFMRRTTNQTLTTSTWTAISFDAEDFDAANGHSTSSNTSRYTATASGKYRLGGCAYISYNSGTPAISAGFRLNGSGTGSSGYIAGSLCRVYPATSTAASIVLPTTLVSLTAGNWVELIVYCDGTSPQVDNAYQASFSVEWVGV